MTLHFLPSRNGLTPAARTPVAAADRAVGGRLSHSGGPARPALIAPALALILLIGLLVPAPAGAYSFTEDVLVFELWTELEPVIPDPLDEERSGGGPLSQREAIDRVLEQARIVVSAMLYGYRVEYTPLDRARKVDERLEIEPIARIERGDPRLETIETRTDESRFYARFRYDLAEHQILRRSGWQSNTIPSVIARGNGALTEGYRGKFTSYEDAIKQGLRSYLRPREFNKPREIIAQVLFREPPYTRINAGGYYSKVHMKLRIQEVVPYGAY